MKFPFFKIFCISLWVSFISTSPANFLSPDIRKLYHDIGSGRGLYTPFDKVTVLNVTYFNDTVFNQAHPKAWVIEFYNSWCGHCHRFAPIWKSLASDILNWQDLIGVGAVDCSNSFNTPLCRDFDIRFYPTIKYFPAKSTSNFLGTPMKQNAVENLKRTIIDAYKKDLHDGAVTKPNLFSYKGHDLKGLWKDVPDVVLYTILVIEDETSYTGAQLAFDLVSVSNIQTRLALSSNVELVGRIKAVEFPAVFICERTSVVREIIPLIRNRTSFYGALKDVFKKKGISLADLEIKTAEEYENSDVPAIYEMMQIDEQIKKKLNMDVLDDVSFQVDLEAALKYSFYNEITSHKVIPGSALEALKRYVKVLAKHFPFGRHGVKYLEHIRDDVLNTTELTGVQFEEIVKKYEKKFEPVFVSKSLEWLGCRGSQPNFRGFPCSLWMMFHTLTVYSANNKVPDESPHEVLHAITGYVEHFFGCSTCAEHFRKMAITFPGNVTNHSDAILWLWRAHNSANKRLRDDPSADPKHPKVQFPSSKSCPSCYTSNNSWDESNVLVFLKSMYQNISYLLIEDLNTPSNPDKTTPKKRDISAVSEEISSNSWDFNIFDVSLCVVLYFCSLAIVIIGCFKFYFKKTHRRKIGGIEYFYKV